MTGKGRVLKRPLPESSRPVIKKQKDLAKLTDQQIIEEVWKRQVRRGVIV